MSIGKKPVLRPGSTSKGQRSLWAAACLGLAVLLAGPGQPRAQEGSVSGSDKDRAPAGETLAPVLERPELGASGTGDYSLQLGRLSIVNPAMDASGLWAVYRVTYLMCRAVFRGEKSLAEAAPEGFRIARQDIHFLGFERENWNGDWYVVTVTGDSERDAAGFHPYWGVRYGDDGRLSECSVTLGTPAGRVEGTTSDAERQRLLLFMYVSVPQLFSAIITEPHHAGLYPLSPGDAINMVAPCRSAWCRITTLYDFRENDWYASTTISFDNPVKME